MLRPNSITASEKTEGSLDLAFSRLSNIYQDSNYVIERLTDVKHVIHSAPPASGSAEVKLQAMPSSIVDAIDMIESNFTAIKALINSIN